MRIALQRLGHLRGCPAARQQPHRMPAFPFPCRRCAVHAFPHCFHIQLPVPKRLKDVVHSGNLAHQWYRWQYTTRPCGFHLGISLGPLIYLSDKNLYPLSLGLFAFRAQRTTEWALLMAGATLTTVPLVLIFFFSQRYFLEGIKMTGLKG